MAKNSDTAPDSVIVRCYTFSNPDSINGPFGTFQLWISGSDIVGRMTENSLLGLGSTSQLNLRGTFSGTGPFVCELQGTGFMTGEIGAYRDPVAETTSFPLTLSADWSTGTIGSAPLQLVVASAPCPGLVQAFVKPNPLEGIWYSSVGSKLELKVEGTVLTGRFDSTQDPNGYVPVHGCVASAETNPNFLPVSFSAAWPADDGFKQSVTCYTGQYSNEKGHEQIEVIFLLVKQTPSNVLWQATRIASDVFKRQK